MDSSSTRGCVGVFASLSGRAVSTLMRRRGRSPNHHMLRGHLTRRIAMVIRSRRSLSVTVTTDGVLFNGTAGRGLTRLSRTALGSMFTGIPRCSLSGGLLNNATMSLFGRRNVRVFPDGDRVHGLIGNNNISLGGRGLTTFSRIMATSSLVSNGCLLIRGNGGGCFLVAIGWSLGMLGVFNDKRGVRCLYVQFTYPVIW